jgi:membrane fusion protein (multidrug efflux system)
MKDNKFLLLILFSLVSALLFSRCTKSTGNPKEFSKGKETPPIPVTGLVIKPQPFENKIEVVGTILPNEKVDLKSESAGRVTGIYFKEGAWVNKGDLLLRIYNNDLQAQLKKNKIQQELATKEEERKRKLLDIKGVSQEEYDITRNALDALKADGELIEAQLRKTEILAPFNGVIGLRNISEGEILSTTTLIASLQQVDPIKVEFDIPEKYSFHINQGAAIDFTISGSDEVYKGVVYAIEPMIDVNTRTLKVRARCSNKNQKLKPGSFIKIDLVLNKKGNSILVPSEAVVPGLKGQKVYVANSGYAIARKVKTGIRTDNSLEITEGLNAEDTVITSGIMQLKDSVKVNLRLKN